MFRKNYFTLPLVLIILVLSLISNSQLSNNADIFSLIEGSFDINTEEELFIEEDILITPKEISQVDDLNCIHDPNCHRNVTYCIFEGCCSVKACRTGNICSVAESQCISPLIQEPAKVIMEEEEDFGEVIIDRNSSILGISVDKSCILNSTCYQNVTYCSSVGCCAEKICLGNQDCGLSVPACMFVREEKQKKGVMVAEEEYSLTDDETCLFDNNCLRNVVYCVYDGCCAVKQCFGGGLCALTEPLCFKIATQENTTETKHINTQTIPNNPLDMICLNNPNCRRNATFCLYDGCCASKICDDFGLCSVQSIECVPPQLTPEQAANLTCIHDPFCGRDASYCLYEGCCATKTCNEFVDCTFEIPDCLALGGMNQGTEQA